MSFEKNNSQPRQSVFKDRNYVSLYRFFCYDEPGFPDPLLNCPMLQNLTATYRPVVLEKGNISLNSILLYKPSSQPYIQHDITLVVKWFGRMFRDAMLARDIEIIAEYIDCKEHSSLNSIFREVLRKFKISSSRGFSNNELIYKLLGALNTEETYLFLILDDITKLPHDEYLTIINLSHAHSMENVRLSTLSVANAKEWLRYSTQKLMEHIQWIKTVEFFPDTDKVKKEILEYLKTICAMTFYEGVFSESLLTEIAELCIHKQSLNYGMRILESMGVFLDQNDLKQATSDQLEYLLPIE